MKKTVCTAVCIILTVAAVFSLSACGDDLLGTWTSVTGSTGATVTFKSSGYVSLSVEGYEISGNYTAENGVIVMNLEDGQGDKFQLKMSYYIDEKKLYLENENGDVEVFSK